VARESGVQRELPQTPGGLLGMRLINPGGPCQRPARVPSEGSPPLKRTLPCQQSRADTDTRVARSESIFAAVCKDLKRQEKNDSPSHDEEGV